MNKDGILLEGHFISSVKGSVFVSQFGAIKQDTAIICLPSITEELNLSRAVIAKQCQYFAQNGLACFCLDYFGTGDSAGQFEQASSDIWLQDILTVGRWLQEKGVKRIILWGVRFGALMMLHFQQQLHQVLPIKAQLLWKPVLSGKQFAGQFLRIKQANTLMQGNSAKINWRQHILDGNEIEVAGYLLNATLLKSIESLAISKTFQPYSDLYWLELACESPTPIIKRTTEQWTEEQFSLLCQPSPAFWQTPRNI